MNPEIKIEITLDYLISQSGGDTLYFDDRCCPLSLLKEAILRGFQLHTYDCGYYFNKFGEMFLDDDLGDDLAPLLDSNKYYLFLRGYGISDGGGNGFGGYETLHGEENGEGNGYGGGFSREKFSFPQISRSLYFIK